VSSRAASAKGEAGRSAQNSEHAPKIVELNRNRVEFHYPSGHVETLIQCPYCRAAGKQMFFVCDIDLRAHISTFHEPQSYTR
jgi:hypothetical protein